MTTGYYVKYLHRFEKCSACGGKGSKPLVGDFTVQCTGCMGLGVKVFTGNLQIKDVQFARQIIASYREQTKKPEAPKININFKTQKAQPPQVPPPWLNPNNPFNPNNPWGWTHPFSPNNPNWRNNPANPNSPNHPMHPMNPNKKR